MRGNRFDEIDPPRPAAADRSAAGGGRPLLKARALAGSRPKRLAAGAAGLAAVALAVSLAGGAASSASARQPSARQPSARGHRPAPLLEIVSVTGYGEVLASSSGHSVYALSSEARGKLHCSGGCLKIWPPLEVRSTVKTVALPAGEKGKVGFVKRSATLKQLTINGYPVYLFSGDRKPRQSNGEGIVALGGTWELVRPSAKTANATLVAKKVPAKKTKKTTTTSASSGGYGY